MEVIIQSAVEKLLLYVGESWHYALFLLAMLYLLCSRGEKEQRKLFVGYSLVFCVIYFFPVTAKIIMKYCTGTSVYWRMFWILPLPMAIAYAAVKVCRKWKKGWVQFLLFVGMACFIGVSGHFLYYGEGTPYVKAVNSQKLPPEIVDICNQIRAQAEEGEEIKLIAPSALNGYIRQYDAGIRQLYGRKTRARGKAKRIKMQIESVNPNIKKTVRLARKMGYPYLIYPSNEDQDQRFQKYGFVPIGQNNAYIIYKDGKLA